MHSLELIAVMSIVTVLLRAAPFLFFKEGKNKYIEYLGQVLPYPIMAMLVVYCLKSIDLLGTYHGVSEIIASIVVIITYVWKRNTLLSIFIGTILYMFCVQVLFI